jgi:hypothetical protein
VRSLAHIVTQDTLRSTAQIVRDTSVPDEPEVEVTAPEPLDEFEADISARLESSYALLIVSRAGTDALAVTGRHRDDVLQLPVSTMYRPNLALGDMADSAGVHAAAIRLLMLEWSRQAEVIREWLERLRAEMGDELLRLVIWDDTGYEIPWELLHLWGDPATGRPAGWLGELVAVTRMLTLHAGDPSERWSPLDLGHHVCDGDTIACVDETMVEDLTALSCFDSRQVNENQLLDRLEQDAPIAFMYFAAHGEYSADMTALTVGRLRLKDFAFGPLPALMRSHSLVFLNACHSGRLLNDQRINASLFGFAEMFLRKGAATVVGAAGKVEDARARQVAMEVINQLAGETKVSIAEAVRRVRANSTSRIYGRDPAIGDLKNFIYTFMYVCYGNPYTTLRGTLERSEQ